MGNDQSSGTSTNSKSRPNSRTLSSNFTRFFSIAPNYHPHITVVNSGPIAANASGTTTTGNTSFLDDSDLNKLAAIPKFLPILRSSINLQNDPAQLPHLENGPVIISSTHND